MIFGPFERMVAGRYLRARRKEGFVSVIVGFSFLGITLGVATLIIVMAVMNGFRQELLGRLLGVNGHIEVSSNRLLTNFDNLVNRILAVPGVESAMPVVVDEVMITYDGVAGGAMVRGVRGPDLARLPWIAGHIMEGSLDAFTAGEGILIGLRMAGQYGVHAGDEITLISPNGNVTAFGTVPRQGTFKIAGIFSVGESEIDSSVVFMRLQNAQVFFKVPDAVSSIEVRVGNPDNAEAIAEQIERQIPTLKAEPWEVVNGPFFNALQVERNVMFLILTLIIIVAAFNVISGLIMMVKDKGRDIAILRTMGATRGMIMRIFFLAGATVGVIGTVTGFLLGWLFCKNIESIREFLQNLTHTQLFSPEIYYLSQIPAKMSWKETSFIFGMSLILSFAATLYPSWRAARIDPVEALRYE